MTHRTESYIKLILALIVGTLFIAAIANEANNLEIEQAAYFEKYGTYFSVPYDELTRTEVVTYDERCRGYIEIDFSKKGKIKYTGYGDLSSKYTYETIIASSSTSPTI